VSAAPILRGAAVSLIGQTGHSDDSHSPDEFASVVVRRYAALSSGLDIVRKARRA
jgi:hypothetical protein